MSSFKVQVGYVFLCAIVYINFVKVKCDVKTKGGKNLKEFKTAVTTSENWIQGALDKHNFYRDKHRVPRLILNNTLSEISQAYANYLLQKGIESFNRSKEISFFDHNKDVINKYSLGENLYYAVNYANINSTFAVRLWYEEIKDFDFQLGFRKKTSHPKAQIGHFTQLVWKSTRQMGTAYAAARLYNGQIVTFVVANYYPPGNVHFAKGPKEYYRYLENVLPPTWEDNEIQDNNVYIQDIPVIIPIRWPQIYKVNVTTEPEWIQKAVDAHNDFRALHGVPPLKINSELTEISQAWGNFLLNSGISEFNKRNKIEHYSQNKQTAQYGIGENKMYFINNGPVVDAAIPVQLWYQGKQYYDFEKGAKKDNTSVTTNSCIDHFTQLIWKSAQEIGIAYSSAKAENGQTLTFIIANYYPSKYAVGMSWARNNMNNVPPANNVDGTFHCASFLKYGIISAVLRILLNHVIF